MANPLYPKLGAWAKRIGAVAAVFGVTSAVVLYALGYYDIAFLDREKIFGKPHERETADSESAPRETLSVPPADTESTADSPADTVTGTSAQDATQETASILPEDGSVASSVVSVTNTALLSDEAATIPASGTLAERGYAITDAVFDAGTMRLGKMKFGYKLPEKFSENTRTVQKAVYNEPSDNSEVTVTYADVTEQRPALELYMGYIFFDRGDKLFFIDSDGVARFTFDDTQTIPAYTRDLSGNPLFYRLTWNGAGYDRVYYRVEGKSFVPSAYNDDADGRGLYFDYPRDYGVPDTGYVKSVEGEEDAAKRYAEEVKAVEDADKATPSLRSRKRNNGRRPSRTTANESSPPSIPPITTARSWRSSKTARTSPATNSSPRPSSPVDTPPSPPTRTAATSTSSMATAEPYSARPAITIWRPTSATSSSPIARP